jgi:hypothetical protein
MRDFEIVRLSDLGYQILMRDPPRNLVTLGSVDELDGFTSEVPVLVLAVAVWSAPDLQAIEEARELAVSLRGDCTVAIVPFDDPDEVSRLWPSNSPRYVGQTWAVLYKGEVQWAATGPQTASVLAAALREVADR